MEGESSDIVLFFGRFHPLILHIPIGVLIIAFVLEVISRFKRFKHYKTAVGLVLFLGAASAVVTVALGLMLAQSGEYNKDLLYFHQWSGIGAGLMATIAFGLHWQAKRRPSDLLDRIYMSVMSLMILSLAVAGHFGGSLTHGSDYLTEHMPEGLRKISGLPSREKKEIKKITNLPEAVVYADIVYPILDTYCISCHNDNKRKGDLMMQTPESLMKGGEDGPALIPGNAANSEMIKRIQLPEDHEDHMPPDGKTQPTDDQVRLLTWWVNEGASFDKKVAGIKVADDVQPILNSLVAVSKTEVELLLDSAVLPAQEQTLAQLQAKGVMITTLSNGINWLQADVAPSQSGDSLVQAFVNVSQQLTWLNLGGTSITDKALSSVGTFKYLTRLHLGNTAITDDGLKYLKDLHYLESLNLYGTQITDEGIQHLAGLKNLKRLYVWKTRVTKEGAARLQKLLPDLEVNMGLEVDVTKGSPSPSDSDLANR